MNDAWRGYPGEAEGHHTVVGDVRVLRDFPGPRASDRRDLFVYLPPSYRVESDRRYPTIYMQDGQNLFDQAISFADEWRVDETMQELADEGIEAIIVGVSNRSVERLDEYSPFVDPANGGGRGEEYMCFIVDAVKPVIDRSFRTRTDRPHTSIAGSSMGGLISLYGFFTRAHVFGAVAAMSPALWFADGAIFGLIEAAPAIPGRCYLDVGAQEGRVTVQEVRRLRRLLHQRGDDEGNSCLYVEEPAGRHGETWWAGRLKPALRFLITGGSEG